MIRKLSFVLALASALSAVPAVAQGQTVVGLRAGLNFSSVDGDDVPVNPDSRTGLNIGGALQVPLSGSAGVLLGASYSQRGAKLSGEDAGEDVVLTLELDYIEIPALLTLTFRSDGALGGHFFFGPALALEIGCEVSLETQGVELSADCDQPEDPVETESFDVGAMGGAGLLWRTAGSLELSLDVLYNYGLTSLVEDQDVKNRTFSVQAGVGFPL